MKFKWPKIVSFLRTFKFYGDSQETIVTKAHSQTLMAMKSGCKIYTQKCYVTLEWPLMLHFKHIGCLAHTLCNVPSENNSAHESALKM